MKNEPPASARRVTRRIVVGGAAALAAYPAMAEECGIGPPAHAKGPAVWLDMDQVELDAAYDQHAYAPLYKEIIKRHVSTGEALRRRYGEPLHRAYGSSAVETLDIYRAVPPRHGNAPIFVFIHGGAWLGGTARDSAFPVEPIIRAGAHCVVPDFIAIRDAGGDLRVMASQVLHAIAWTYRNAASFGGDRNRLYVGGVSSGGHFSGVAATTDWHGEFGLPTDMLKGVLCGSGMYDLKPVRLSRRGSYIVFTDEMEAAMSPQRHLDRLRAPIIVTYGGNETPEFQRQGRDFAAAVKAAGKLTALVAAPDYNHYEMAQSFDNPYGPNGRAALALMKLGGG